MKTTRKVSMIIVAIASIALGSVSASADSVAALSSAELPAAPSALQATPSSSEAGASHYRCAGSKYLRYSSGAAGTVSGAQWLLEQVPSQEELEKIADPSIRQAALETRASAEVLARWDTWERVAASRGYRLFEMYLARLADGLMDSGSKGFVLMCDEHTIPCTNKCRLVGAKRVCENGYADAACMLNGIVASS